MLSHYSVLKIKFYGWISDSGVAKGRKWGNAPWSACFGSATAHFLQLF